jgi:hypothetical protein
MFVHSRVKTYLICRSGNFNIVTLYWQLAQSSVGHHFVNTAKSLTLSLYGQLVTSLISVCCLAFFVTRYSLFPFVHILSLFLIRHKFFVWHYSVSFSVRSFAHFLIFSRTHICCLREDFSCKGSSLRIL